MNDSVHRPVMLKEVIGYLDPKPGDKVVDATVGLAGHSAEILKKISPGGFLTGIDADRSALEISSAGLKDFEGNFKLIQGNFRNLNAILTGEKIKNVDAILFDIGVSSCQMDDPGRGFGIKSDSRLDMRMDQSSGLSAYEIVNRRTERELSDMIKTYGEERFHNRIARRIIYERSGGPIETTRQLALAVYRAVGPRYSRSKIDPATRTFQAIRIAVNDELAALEEGVKEAVSWLKAGGRMVVISFHSLEDRIVKNLFRDYAKLGILKLLTKKPVRPSVEEVRSNPRSRSGRLRAAERL